MRKNKRTLYFAGCLLLAIVGHAQKPDSTLSLNSLKSPVSPASTILGINSSDIHKPTDLTGLLLSVRNATNDFTTIPSAFGLDLAPKWLFDKKAISLQDFLSNNVGKNMAQTFLLSYAQASQKDSNYNGLKQGIGFKVSFLRGQIRDEKFINTINKIRDLHKMEFELEEKYDSLHGGYKASEGYKKLDTLLNKPIPDDERRKIDNQMEDIERIYNDQKSAFVNAQMKDLYAAIFGKLEETITPVRKGFILDLSAGTIIKYDDYKINSSSVTNSSVWLTFGYDGFKTDTADNSYFTILGLSRLVFNNADELYKAGVKDQYSSWDNGVRLAFNTASQKFTLSGEVISRTLFSTSIPGKKSLVKYLLSAELQLGKNQRLSFTYGKDFEDRVTEDGNVIALLNFVTGFFGKKSFD